MGTYPYDSSLRNFRALLNGSYRKIVPVRFFSANANERGPWQLALSNFYVKTGHFASIFLVKNFLEKNQGFSGRKKRVSKTVLHL